MVAVSLKKKKKNVFFFFLFFFLFFFFKQKTAYEISLGLVGSEMCIRDSVLGRAFFVGSRPLRSIPIAHIRYKSIPGTLGPVGGLTFLEHSFILNVTSLSMSVFQHGKCRVALGVAHRARGQ